jgi:hypothetical protein
MPEYHVTVAGEYDFVKIDDNIKACRAWAKRAFPRHVTTVTREHPYRFCPDCQSAPCCCMVREDV